VDTAEEVLDRALEPLAPESPRNGKASGKASKSSKANGAATGKAAARAKK